MTQVPPDPVATADAEAHGDACGPGCIEVEHNGRRLVVDVAAAGEVVVGRSAEASVCVDEERLSRRHLRVALADGQLWARDLDSKNGTQLNGRRLEGERRLRGGDLLELGSVRVRVGGPARPAGLLDEGDLIDRLDEECERAAAFKRPLGVVGLKLLGPASAVDHAAARLISRLGPGEALGEYAAGRLVGVLPERRLDAAEELARNWAQVASEVAGVSVRARAGAAPESGSDADDLLAAAFAEGAAEPKGEGKILVAEDKITRAMFEMARKAAVSNATVLVIGETGAGKEWVAAEIHATSPRKKGPYVRINCAALPETLIESELFGHEKGAFTGAERRRIGLLESAHGGTAFLDEIGELPAAMQAKLLHVLEDRQVVRVGSNERHDVDVRFVAATNRDLEREARAGRFREDLFFRLSAIVIDVPPLRERPLDLAALAEAFIAQAARAAGRRPPRMSASFFAALQSYPWPGNVRELKNVIERAVILGEGDELSSRQLPDRMRSPDAPAPAPELMRKQVDAVEQKSVEAALAAVQGNRTHAARRLGISRRALIYKLHKFGLLQKSY